MRTYTDFTDKILMGLYYWPDNPGKPVLLSRVAEKYAIECRAGWLLDAQHDLEGLGYAVGPGNSRNDDMAAARITGAGRRRVEDLIENSEDAQGWALAFTMINGEDDPDRSPADETGAREGAEIEIEIPAAPASDRLVRLDHNQPQYSEIAQGIDAIYEQVRQDNEVGETADERDRLLTSLRAAQELWSAAQLHIIQIRIGIVMAIEDASNAITKVGKTVGTALLVDLIKKFVKNAAGIDF